MTDTIVTRFAPSPTGFLHIGSARTALFNMLYAKANGGTYLLRVEDTDQKRSTEQATQAIHDGLAWLGLSPDQEPMYQSKRIDRHKEVVQELLDKGMAYYCYTSKEELDELRQEARDKKMSFRYPHIWRDRDPKEAPEGVEPVVRIKAPLEGSIVIEDKVQGTVEVSADTLDDMIILRADGTPTYMLAVVVDDIDMGVTHVIRGDDHLTNTFRQCSVYDALGAQRPTYAHIPLIHGPDGAKMSKRHGALGVDAYKDMGYLPEAICNYLLRLGWSHGDDEFMSREQAIAWFDLEHIGKSPSRFDFDKLANMNAHYIKEKDNHWLSDYVISKLAIDKESLQAGWIVQAMDSLKLRAKTLVELVEGSKFFVEAPREFTDKAQKQLDESGKALLVSAVQLLEASDTFDEESLQALMEKVANDHDTKLGKVMGPIRSAITGSHASPSMFEVMRIMGKEEVLSRLKSCS